MLAQHGPIPLRWMPSAVHSVYSTQNAQQAALAARFERLGAARNYVGGPRFRARRLELPADSGTADNFRTDIWYRALVSKVTHWAELAEQNVGKLLLCSDNDISLLPGWVDALAWAFVDAGPVDVLFQREGGADAFFEPFPYNSGFFLMNGSAALGRFWRQVAARTASERPFTGDQAVVNSLLMPRGWGDDDLRCDDPLGIRHAHFPPRLVRGGPTPPADADELRAVRVHHATASGSAQGKLDALDGFLAAWLAAHNLTRAELALPPAGAAWTDT